MPTDLTRGDRSRHFRWFAIFAAMACAAVAWLFAYRSAETVRQAEIERHGQIQLGILSQIRNSLEDRLDELELKLPVFVRNWPGTKVDWENRDEVFNNLVQKLNLNPISAYVRLYSPQRKISWELGANWSRHFAIANKELDDLFQQTQQLSASEPDYLPVHSQLVPSQSTEPPIFLRLSLRLAFAHENRQPEQTSESSIEPAGLLCIWVSLADLISEHAQRRLLPETYEFALLLNEGPNNTDAHSLQMIWHSREPFWDSNSPGFKLWLTLLRKTPFRELNSDTLICQLCQIGNETKRDEVVTFVTLKTGIPARRLLLGMSTPKQAVTEVAAALTYSTYSFGLLSLGLFAVGAALFVQQGREFQSALVDERERLLQRLFAENPTAMLVLDHAGRLLDCNDSARYLFDWVQEDHLGHPITELFTIESIQSSWELLRASNYLRPRDVRLRRANKDMSRLVEIWGRHIGDTWVLMANDVEARRDLERQVARLKRMDSVGSLASTLAHDFNNLLGQIQILVSNLRHDLVDAPNVQADLAAIEQKVDDAAQLVANLLAFQQTVITRDPQWLEPMLREFVTHQRRLLPTPYTIDLEARRDLPPIWISPHALRRVLDNLCQNALDAMPNGGAIQLRTGIRRIAPENATEDLPVGNYTELIFVDTGMGIDLKHLDVIFEPFYSTKNNGKSSGLGLWTVYNIVRRVGGAIHVHSERGKGTRFTILFPDTMPEVEPFVSRC